MFLRCFLQKYAEVQTSFVRRYVGRLNGFWSIEKTDTDYHKLRFNDDYDNPLICVQGWNKFKEWHDLPNNVEIELIYNGNRKSGIYSINDLDSRIHVPSFHSRSLHPTKTAYFDMQLAHSTLSVPKLVSCFTINYSILLI
jgi:hypothetical protein